MSRRRSSKDAVDLSKSARERAKALGEILREIQDNGHLPTFAKAIETVQAELQLPDGSLGTLITMAESRAKAANTALGEKLRDRAKAASCQFDYKRPYVSFGCVTLRDKGSDTWEVSVLDGVPLETVQGTNADFLADCALRQIEDIESALKRVSSFIDDLKYAYEYLRSVDPGIESTSPNLLMQLCASGRNLRKQFISGVGFADRAISRPQMAYLLKHADQLAHAGESTIRLRLRPATQHVTRDPARFIPIPNDSDPRQMTHHTPVSEISLITERPGA